MTTVDETKVNGHAAPADKLPRGLPRHGGTPAWGTPPGGSGAEPGGPTEEGFEGLRAGDETGPDTGGPVERHLITVGPGPRARLAALTGDEPILPAWMRDRQVARQKAVRARRATGRALLLALVNSWQLLRVAWWILRGLRGWVRRTLRWALDVDSDPLSGGVQARTQQEYDRAVVLRGRRQKFRLELLGVAVLVVAVLAWLTPTWAVDVVAALVVAAAGRAGKPEEVRLLSPGVRRHIAPRLTCGLVARALAEVVDSTTAKAIRANSDELWQSGFVDVRGGHRIRIVLPGSAVSAPLVQHEQRIASALGRPEDCAVVEPLPHITTGHFHLYVFDKPMLGGKPQPGPLLKAKKTSWWAPVSCGQTRTGRPHMERIHGGAWFIGGKPESGKSALGLIVAAHTVLDPNALLIIVNLKGSADYWWAKPVCHKYISTTPERDPRVSMQVTAIVQWLLDEADRRGEFFTKLVEQGKATGTAVTEELSRKYKQLQPITVILDEIHRMFDKTDNPDYEAFAELLGKVIKAVRFVAISLVGITQLAGSESVPGVVTRAARVRACLRVSESVSFRQIYGDAGAGTFANLGIARFPQGTALMTSQEGMPTKVGCWFLEPHLAEIGKRALALRQDLRTLTGEAAGEPVKVDAGDPADLLRHLLDAIATTAPAGGPEDGDVAWVAELETVLTARHEAYTGRAKGWLATELRARKVPTTPVNRRVPTTVRPSGQRNEAGVKAAAVRKALEDLITD